MASRSTNTMSEVLESIVTLLGTAKMMPDADIVWLTDLETQVLEKARAPFAQQGVQPAPASTGGGGMGGGMAGAMAATPGGPGDGLASLLGGMGPGMPGPPNDPAMAGGPPAAPMTGMAGPGGGGRSMGSLGEVQRIMGAGPPRGARG